MQLFYRGAFLLLLAASVGAISIQDQMRKSVNKLRAEDLCAQKAASKSFCDNPDNAAQCTQAAVTAWLSNFNKEAQIQSNWDATAAWNYVTNINDQTRDYSNMVSENVTEWFVKKLVEALRYTNKSNYDEATNDQISLITATNSLCKQSEILRLVELDSKLSQGYSSIEACIDGIGCLTGQSAFATEMSKTEDYDKLRELWEKYTNGAKVFKNDFTERKTLLNKGAVENGYADSGYYEWFTDVGDEDFLDKMEKLLKEIDPLYRQLHAFVRYRLSEKYKGKVDLKKSIPIHLTRNMYGQTWNDLIGLVKPYPNVPDTDITAELVAQNYDAVKIFRLSEEFFWSIQNYNMTSTFWEKSMLEKPKDRLVECHGSAWDFQLEEDYRVKMCTLPNMAEFTTVHHEMGHIEYFMAYRPQLYVHRDGAQSGFHEAIGDTITLSVLTPEHLKAVGLLKGDIPTSDEYDLNFLMSVALDKLPFFSFSLMMDLWRWKTFNNTITPENYNKRWWRMRLEMGGIVPPAESDRSSESYFDPGAKFHVTNNVPYIRYFMSYFLQFQFYQSMCAAANHKGKLHRCDFYNSVPAGQKLKTLMQYGRSKNWHDQLLEITGTREISSAPILAYFEPLRAWLEAENKRLGNTIGWEVPQEDSASSNRSTVLLLFTAVVATLFRYW